MGHNFFIVSAYAVTFGIIVFITARSLLAHRKYQKRKP